jgi:hypothetical protein
VTAKHVVEDPYAEFPQAPHSLKVGFGADLFDVSGYWPLEDCDLAILDIPSGLRIKTLRLRRTPVEPGETVYALGFPLGLDRSITQGIVSTVYSDYLQFNAAVSSGNSGGPLLDVHGDVIGIVTMASHQGNDDQLTVQNLNLAVPATLVPLHRARNAQARTSAPSPEPRLKTPTPTPKFSSKPSPRATPDAPRATPILPTTSGSIAIEFIRTEIPGSGVALNLPIDWQTIPPDIIQRYNDAVASASTNPAQARRAMNYVYAAQRKAEDYFMYPYLLVQILKTGRISEAQLKSLPSDAFREGIAEGKEEIKGFFSVIQGFKINTPIYDPTTKRIWLEVSSTVSGLGSVHGLQAMIPTETGFVEIDMYSKEGDFTSWAPLFRTIGTNVELSPSIAYQPRWTDDPTISWIIGTAQTINWIKVATWAALGAVLVLGRAFVTWIGHLISGKNDPKRAS